MHMPRTNSDLSRLVQSRISKQAKEKLLKRAATEALSEAAYVRRLIYRDLELIKEA